MTLASFANLINLLKL